MYHSITIGEKNTWEDWHLIPSSRPLFVQPSPKTTYVDLPGADSGIDLSESLTGYPVYDYREGSNSFYVIHDEWLKEGKNWAECYTEILEYIHGRTFHAVLEDDPNYYYIGRFSIDSWTSNKDYSTIGIHYKLQPYKYRNELTIRNYTISGETNVTIDGFSQVVVPSIFAVIDSGSEMTIRRQKVSTDSGFVDTSTYYLNNGTNRIPTIPIRKGVNHYIITGSGEVTFEFREGRL